MRSPLMVIDITVRLNEAFVIFDGTFDSAPTVARRFAALVREVTLVPADMMNRLFHEGRPLREIGSGGELS
jgi:hypothetical protein